MKGEVLVTLEPAQHAKQLDAPDCRTAEILYTKRPGGQLPTIKTGMGAAIYMIEYLQQHTQVLNDPREHGYILALNTKLQALCEPYLLSIGNDDCTLLDARNVYRFALTIGAATIIVAHTHPSGIVTPSVQDIGVARGLKSAGEIIGITLCDSIIISGCHRIADKPIWYSLKEGGLL